MIAKTTLTISREARAAAEKKATANGYSTAEAYIEALLLDGFAETFQQPWVHAMIEEGLASPDDGELTPERVDQLVDAGISRARRRRR